LDIHFTVGTPYERAAPLAEKNAAVGLSDFSVRGAARGNVRCFVSQSRYHVAARANLARVEPNRSGSLSSGKVISLCSAHSVETVLSRSCGVDERLPRFDAGHEHGY
jgi:hypothetical protein